MLCPRLHCRPVQLGLQCAPFQNQTLWLESQLDHCDPPRSSIEGGRMVHRCPRLFQFRTLDLGRAVLPISAGCQYGKGLFRHARRSTRWNPQPPNSVGLSKGPCADISILCPSMGLVDGHSLRPFAPAFSTSIGLDCPGWNLHRVRDLARSSPQGRAK